MIKPFFLFLYMTQYSPSSFSQSAIREPLEDYHQAERRVLKEISQKRNINRTRLPYHKLDFSNLINFSSLEELRKYFVKIRNIRFLDDPKRDNYQRRSSWMYPDNGCWIRAQLMNYNLKRFHKIKLHKVFIYGNLKPKTNFHPDGYVRWWYHVVVIAKVGNIPYIFDPAIYNMEPLTLESWSLTQVENIADAEFEICHGDTYTPYSECVSPDTPDYLELVQDQNEYLNKERKRLKLMNLDVEALLGDFPPWK